MHLALITETFPPEVNGVAMTLGRLAAGVALQAHRVEVVRPRQSRDDRRRTVDGIEHVTVQGLPIPRYPELKFGLPARGLLVRRWRRNRPDVVHIATEGPLGLTALWAAQRLGIPLSSSFHTNFHEYGKHYSIGFLGSIGLAYMRSIHNRCAVTMVPSDDVREALTAQGFERVTVLARGVDTDLFDPAKRSDELRRTWGVGPDDLLVTYVGRVAGEKNIPLTIKAFEAIKQRAPQAKLLIVGDGPVRAKLEAQHPEYIFAGMQRGEDLAVHYASGDLFLFPSITETFGNVITEAMASGLAVVAFDYAAARMHIVHDENGVKAPFDDSDAFIDAAVALGGDRPRIERLRAAARQTTLGLTWDAIIHGFLDTLQQIAAGRPVCC